jgi:predicted RNA-binding Zn-ribbon protein involved in translation (DUF1610 family)
MSQSRETAVDRIIAEYQRHWDSMTLVQRSSAISRVTAAAGIGAQEALERMSNPPCPRCGSTNIERGDVVVCRVCGNVMSV